MSKIKNLILTAVLLSHLCEAQVIRIEKVKDNKAIVEILDGSVTPGESFQLSSAGSAVGKTTPRKNLFGLSGGLTNSSRSSTASTVTYTTINITTKYGLNKVNTEYGGLIGIDYASTSGSSATGFLLGGFFDFNLIPHKASSESVYGIGAEASVGSAQSPTTAYKAVSTYKIFAGGFYKWFPFKTSTAIRSDLGFRYQSYSESPTVTESGLTGFFGLAHYY